MDITVRSAMALRSELDLMLLRHDGNDSDHLGLTLLAQAIIIEMLDRMCGVKSHDDQQRS